MTREERYTDSNKERERGRSGILTLDVNRDTGLLAVGHCLVGGLADDRSNTHTFC